LTDSYNPLINNQAIAILTQIGRSANDRFSERLFSNDFGVSKVTEFYLRIIYVGGKQNIFRFEVAVNDVFAVQVLEGNKNLQ
jgi:hypothetical protein